MTELREHAFSDLYEMSSGISSTPAQAGHGAPFLSFSTVFNSYFLPDVLPDLMNTSKSEQKTYSVKEGDIFLTRTSETVDELGMSSAALKDYPGATYSGFLKRLRPTAEGQTDPKFMAFYLRSPLFRKTITNNAVMVLRASLNEQVFSYLKLLLPDFDAQAHIGEFLHLLNAKIDLNNRINAELEALAKTIYDYWFVQFDFPDANGRPYKTSGGKMVWNDALKREIPAGWESVSLRNLVDCNVNSYSANNLPDEIAYLDTGNLTDNRLFDLEKYDTSKDEVPSRARRIAANGDVLYSTVRPNQNHHGIIKEAIESLVVSTGFAVLTCTDKHLNGDFIYMFTRTNDVAVKMQRIAESSRSSYPSIAPDDLLDLRLALPEDRAQASNVCQFFDQTFKNIWANEKENRELTQLRDWLLPLLMNGQVKVA